MSNKGFIESLLESLSLWAAVQDSKNDRGKPDPFKAAGIAMGMNDDLSTENILELGGYLGAEGAFDASPVEDTAPYTTIQPALTPEQERKSMNWNELSEAEKHRRISKANQTKSMQWWWKTKWNAQTNVAKRSPLEVAEELWKSLDSFRTILPDPELHKKLAKWLRKKHDIRIDANGKAHIIKRKKQTP